LHLISLQNFFSTPQRWARYQNNDFESMASESECVDTLRASVVIPRVQSSLASFYEAVADGRTSLSSSQLVSVAEQVAELRRMKETLAVLVQRYVEEGDEERLASLFEVYEAVENALELQQQQQQVHDTVADNEEPKPHDIGDWVVIERENDDEEIGSAASSSSDSDKNVASSSSSNSDNSAAASSAVAASSSACTSMSCPICFDDAVDASELFRFDECGHSYCRECVSLYLASLINEGNVEAMACPDPSCTTALGYEQIKGAVEADVFERYERFSLMALLKADPLTRFCPVPGCECAMTLDERQVAEAQPIECAQCSAQFCSQCALPYHGEQSCAAARATHEPLDRRTERRLRRMGAQRCPNCQIPIVRALGCREMQCTGCQTEFTWQGDPGETTIEALAYSYPRLLKHVSTSRELSADGVGAQIFGATAAAVIGLPFLAVSLVCAPFALPISAFRLSKRGIENMIEDREARKEEEEEEEEEEAAASEHID
jgi:IBR domain, a half RING-finger domain/Zinc finger, C3HC4 type (RING finger)